MSEELGAVLESPELVEEVEQIEAPEGIAADPVEPIEGAAPVEKDNTDWRKVPAELKEFFKTPAGKGAKDAWFERNAYKELLPEGVKQAKEILGFLEEYGGKDGLTTALGELQSKASEYEALSQKIESGDASLVTDLPPETISKLGPTMNQEWAKADPEGWQASMSGVMAATLSNAQVPIFLERLGLNLEYGKLEEVKTQIAQLKEFLGSFAAKAQVTPTAKPNQGKQDDGGKAAFAQEKQDFFISKIVDKAETSFRIPTITKELESYIKRRPTDTDTRDHAISTVKAQVMERMKQDAGYQKSLTAFTSRGDEAGALKLLKSREEAAIKEIAPKVGRLIYGNPTGSKADTTTAATSATKVETGFALVDKAPKPELVDRLQTTDAMIMRGKFILKDGRKLALQD